MASPTSWEFFKEVEKKILDSYSNNLELIKDKLSNNNKEATALLIESNFLDIKIQVS